MSSQPVRSAATALLMVLIGGQDSRAQEFRPGPPGSGEIALVVSPAHVPVPAFRHRLLPTTPGLNPGDAAPIYLRLGYELPNAELQAAHKQAIAWLDLPIDQFPLVEAGGLIDRWAPQLKQIEFGARRRGCDWNYTIREEQDDPLSLRMPDAAAMRVWGRLLALKARVEVASGRLDDAIRTVATGLALGRHVAGGPYFINVLTGAAIVEPMLDRVEELVARPDAPSLYWALTALPRPFLSTHAASENEAAMIGHLLDAVAVDQPRSAAEWSATLARLHGEMVRLTRLVTTADNPIPAGVATLEAFRATMLPKARAYLTEREIPATSDDQALVLAIVGGYRELADDHLRFAYIDVADSATLRGPGPVGRMDSGAAGMLAQLIPTFQGTPLGVTRVARRIAELRVIEALRLHAGENQGQLPATLAEVKGVPVPVNPMTGRPFEYRHDGASAVLTGPAPPTRRPTTLRITVRP